MILPDRAISSHLVGGRKRAEVCSMPPSCFGVAMTASSVVGRWPMPGPEFELEDSDARGRK